jgi:hypothetical protein
MFAATAAIDSAGTTTRNSSRRKAKTLTLQKDWSWSSCSIPKESSATGSHRTAGGEGLSGAGDRDEVCVTRASNEIKPRRSTKGTWELRQHR